MLTALVQTAGTAIITRGEPVGAGVAGYVLLAFSGLALADRLRFPRRNFLIVAGCILVYLMLGRPADLAFLAPMFGASAVLAAGHRWLVWACTAGGYGLWAVVTGPSLNRALTAAAWVVGVLVFTEIATPVNRAVQKAFVEQQRLTEERRRRKASEERLRIAAELHDVLGHHLSLINVRAGVGLHLMDREPEQARLALDTIQQTSAEALREVQAVLSTLYPAGDAAPRVPAPGLDRLERLTADAGLPAATSIVGAPRPLPAEVDRAAYRIVQEALTNVRRHAGPGAAATITVEYRPEALVIQVDDTGGSREPAGAPPGNGITGMRERALAFGGELTAGPAPVPPGGWRVRVTFPLPVTGDGAA